MREHQNKHTHTPTTLTHSSLLYVHRVSSSRSLGILLNTQMLYLNKSSTELIEFCEVFILKVVNLSPKALVTIWYDRV